MPIDLTEFLVPEIHDIQTDLQNRALELTIAYEDPEKFERERGVKVADLEATFNQMKAERDRLLGVVEPTPPTDDQLKDAFKEKRLEEERLRLARDKAEQELRDEGKLPPPKPIPPALDALIDKKIAAAIEAAEVFKADGGLDE